LRCAFFEQAKAEATEQDKNPSPTAVELEEI